MKLVTLACDKCGTPDEKGRVTTWTARRGSRRYSGELCDKCFEKLVKDFKPTTHGTRTHVIEETKMKDIPRNA